MYLFTKPVTSVVRRNLSLKSLIISIFPFKPKTYELLNTSVKDIRYSCSSLVSTVESVLLSERILSDGKQIEKLVSSENISSENKCILPGDSAKVQDINCDITKRYSKLSYQYLNLDFTQKVGPILFIIGTIRSTYHISSNKKSQ